MKTAIYFVLAIFPSWIQVPLRRILGQKIGKKSKIKFGTILIAKNVNIDEGVSIGPFSYVRAQEIAIGRGSKIQPLSSIKTRIVKMGEFAHIAPFSMITSEFTINSKIEIGNRSRIFPYCWIDTGEGVFIGENVGIGGHTLIFTHGVWPNYVNGGPISYGPVHIEDNVWLPWRVFLMPNITIGRNSIVGANSLVNKSFLPNSLLGGSPAKIIKENITIETTLDEKADRMNTVLKEFSNYMDFKKSVQTNFSTGNLEIEGNQISIDESETLKQGDILICLKKTKSKDEILDFVNAGISVIIMAEETIYLKKNTLLNQEFTAFVRRYGIRFYIN